MIVYPLVLVVWKVWKVWKLWNFRLSCKPPATSEAVLKSLAGRTSLLHFVCFGILVLVQMSLANCSDNSRMSKSVKCMAKGPHCGFVQVEE